jgi:hypothetical protein
MNRLMAKGVRETSRYKKAARRSGFRAGSHVPVRLESRTYGTSIFRRLRRLTSLHRIYSKTFPDLHVFLLEFSGWNGSQQFHRPKRPIKDEDVHCSKCVMSLARHGSSVNQLDIRISADKLLILGLNLVECSVPFCFSGYALPAW